jgi:hypothetical protein
MCVVVNSSLILVVCSMHAWKHVVFGPPLQVVLGKKKMKCLYIESSGRLEDHKEQAHGLNQKYRSW